MFSITDIFGGHSTRIVKKYQPLVDKINVLEAKYKALNTQQLAEQTIVLKERLAKGETLNDILPDAFAVVREASQRTLGQRHFDVQLIGGMVLHSGAIAEMKTGEGKTLVATLPAYLNALEGKGVHIVTVNDYLSRRDAVWMGQIYAALGMTVGVINTDASYRYDPAHQEKDAERDENASFKVVYEFLRPCTRVEAYQADITYGTNNEYGFDYLRDNIEYEVTSLRQKEHHYAIVDEIDSILIDEARTPLIISAPTVESEDLYTVFAGMVKNFSEGQDYTVDEKFKQIQLTDAGIARAEKALGVGNIYTDKGITYVHHLETAVRAKALFRKEKEYVVRNDEVIIVDEFTGRMQPGRRWSDGLHQAIEAKEGVRIQKETRTYASITFQNYFRMYRKLAGMTGTAETSKEEFFKVYALDTIVIPTHRPIARTDLNDLIFQTEHGKFTAVAHKVKELHQKGQPVLVGTVSIERNEVLSSYLDRVGVPHQVLNAKNHEKEGEIIARAGAPGAVTIATNMAGRGVDIKINDEVRSKGGLYVIGTERHEARRIDNQLRGRSGRQGDPGATQFFVSLEDSLMRIFAADTVKSMMGKMGLREDEPIENYLLTRGLESAQTKIEGLHFDSRKHTLQYDDVMNYQRKIVYERRRKLLIGPSIEGGDDLKALLDEVLTSEHATDEVKATIEAKRKAMGDEAFYQAVRRLMLQTIDMFWIDHLEQMDHLRGSVNLRAYGQRDPLVEYKREGLKLFKDMEQAVNDQVYSLIPSIEAIALTDTEKKMKEVQKQATLLGGSDTASGSSVVRSGESKHGRNDRITIEKDGMKKEIKYKHLEQHLQDGWKEI